MSELNHRFQAGRMNKDLDERLVPNGEYRDALNIELLSSEGSNVGSLQTVMGNFGLSGDLERDIQDGYCIGSIADEKNDKLYWLISAVGKDIIAEYDYATKLVSPVVVDTFSIGTPANSDSGRALNFDRFYLVTGINIVDGILFWTDNNTEPKKVHIERAKQGSQDFNNQTQFLVRSKTTNTPLIEYIPDGPIKQEHLTVIKKSPPTAPTLEMIATTRGDINAEGDPEVGSIRTTMTLGRADDPFDCSLFQDPANDYYLQSPIIVIFDDPINGFSPDYEAGDYITISHENEDGEIIEIRAHIEQKIGPGNRTFEIIIMAGDLGLKCWGSSVFEIELEQKNPLFQFKFPRFGYRYKYEDGE